MNDQDLARRALNIARSLSYDDGPIIGQAKQTLIEMANRLGTLGGFHPNAIYPTSITDHHTESAANSDT